MCLSNCLAFVFQRLLLAQNLIYMFSEPFENDVLYVIWHNDEFWVEKGRFVKFNTPI